MLRLLPSDYLIALGFLGQTSTAVLTLSNPSALVVAYKVKTNCPDKLQLANHKGVLLPQESVEVVITLAADWPEVKEGRLQVVAMHRRRFTESRVGTRHSAAAANASSPRTG